ncbi:MAG TPA: DUF433 domain-containing protein [Gemmataceae bacterium]|jgi:uncharacterized protein (DUF433 family)
MTLTLALEPRAVPLTRLENGVYRVTGTRIPLERIVECYQDGMTPEDIVRDFDTLSLPDVYAVISYYLDHKDAVEEYMRERDKAAEALRRMIEADPSQRPGWREELLARRARMEKDNDVPAGH